MPTLLSSFYTLCCFTLTGASPWNAFPQTFLQLVLLIFLISAQLLLPGRVFLMTLSKSTTPILPCTSRHSITSPCFTFFIALPATLNANTYVFIYLFIVCFSLCSIKILLDSSGFLESKCWLEHSRHSVNICWMNKWLDGRLWRLNVLLVISAHRIIYFLSNRHLFFTPST